MTSSSPRGTAGGLEILAPVTPAFSSVLTEEALKFVADLQRTFGERRKECA